MTNKLKIFATILAVSVVYAFGFLALGGILGYHRAKAQYEFQQQNVDTVSVTDTIAIIQFTTDTVIKTVNVPFYVAVHDTLVDSVWVDIPIERHFASIPDTADIWYSGFQAKIDSMRFYQQTTTITNTVVKTDYKTPRLTLDLGTSALYNQQNINPYLVGEICLNRPKTTFSAFGCINQYGDWAAGLNVTYRINIIK